MHKICTVIRTTQRIFTRLCHPRNYFQQEPKSSQFSGKLPEIKDGCLLNGWRLLFGKYLLITNTIASSVLMGIGDLMQQKLENLKMGKPKFCYDWKRNMHMTEMGAIQGFMAHCFYFMLDTRMPGTKLYTIAKKIAIDQGIFAPICICVFFVGLDYINGCGFEASVNELKEKFLIVFLVDSAVWIPNQFINFYLLPPRFRVLYLAVISLLYNMFLSFAKHNNVRY